MKLLEARNEVLSCLDEIEIEYGLNLTTTNPETGALETWQLEKIFTPTVDGVFYMSWANKEDPPKVKNFKVELVEVDTIPLGYQHTRAYAGWYDEENGKGKE